MFKKALKRDLLDVGEGQGGGYKLPWYLVRHSVSVLLVSGTSPDSL